MWIFFLFAPISLCDCTQRANPNVQGAWIICELLNFPFTLLYAYLSFSTASALPSTRQRHKKMSALLQSHQGSHKIDSVEGLRTQKKQFIRVHLLYGWQEHRWIIERTSLKIRAVVYLTGMQDIWGVKSPEYSAITNENRSPITVSGHVYGGRQRLSRWTFAGTDESLGGGSILTRFPFLPVHLVGSTPSSEPWRLWNNHLTLSFFGSRATQAVHSRCREQQLHAMCTTAHWGRW